MKSYFDMSPLEKLYELRSTLQEVASAERTQLKMDAWFTEMPTEHFCNSACCIMGYQALKEVMKSPRELDMTQITRMAENIVEDMAEHDSLSVSIWSNTCWDRKRSALAAGLFSRGELDSFNYLHTHFPNFNDAIEYLNACIVKMESSHEHS